MHDDGVVTENEPEVFATPAHLVDAAAAHVVNEAGRTAGMSAHGAGVENLGANDAAPDQVGGQSTTDDLHLGQFRHR